MSKHNHKRRPTFNPGRLAWLALAMTTGAALAQGQAAPPRQPQQQPTVPNTGDALLDTMGLTSANKVQTTGAQQAHDGSHLKVTPLKGATAYIAAAFPSAAQPSLSLFSGYDGKLFTSLASETYAPPGGVRDPSIFHAEDGYYYVAYTPDAAPDKTGGFAVARSRDLRNWAHVADIALPGARAPEWLKGRDGKMHVIVSSVQGGGPAVNYLLTATGPGMKRFGKPVRLPGLDGYADAFAVHDGGTYRLFARRQATGYLEMATASDPAGPWTLEQAGDWAGWGAGLGAPSLLKLDDGGWRLYFEGDGGLRYYTSDSKDLRSWTPKAELVSMSGTARHFTVMAQPAKVFDGATAPKHKPQKITWDKHSLMFDGRRKMIWGGEIHPFRLPSPDLWRDVLQKMKAMGMNTVSFYFDWGYHTARPGEYDFTGIRNMERAIAMAEELDMYVIMRVGPYVNAELTRGGFPGWLARQQAVARTDAPDYIRAADEWLAQVNAIVARHQLTDGGGKVIAYQLENELSQTTDTHLRYMRYLHDKARADGITVPLFHNSAGRLPNWTPPDSSAPFAVPGPVDLYAFDGYPGGGCTNTRSPGKPNTVPNWGMYGEMPPAGAAGPVKIGALASPKTPGFAAEIGGGWFDFWGSVGSYECTAQRIGSSYTRVFYGSSLVNALSIHTVYMLYGGTSWGWSPASVVYTSYDYGAAIDEGRGLREKALTLKQMGHFVQAAEGLLAKMDKAEPLKASSERIRLYHNISPDTGARLIYAQHVPSDATTSDPFSFALKLKAGSYTVPQQGRLALNGHDAKLLLADYALERQHLVYTTSDTQTHLRQGARDLALLYGRAGEDGETVLRYAKAPKVDVLRGQVAHAYDAARGDLRLNYVHKELAVVRITPPDGAPLLLLLADDAVGRQMWKVDTAHGPVLLRSPGLVRSAAWRQGVLAVEGDSAAPSSLELWAGRAVAGVRFNGQALKVPAGSDGRDGHVVASGIAGPAPYQLPDLMALPWGRRLDSPEARPDFDDSLWRKADLAVSAATTATQPPQGQPVLAMSDYGFHHGDVWYRGRFELAPGHALPTQLELAYGGGGAGMLQAWLDGVYLGGSEVPSGEARPKTMATASFTLPPDALKPGPHVLSVMVRNNSHNWDLAANDEHKEARGLVSATLAAPQGPKSGTTIAWKLQGNRGGETIADLVRGPMNNGGLYGERQGWYLPTSGAAVADGWTAASPGAAPPQPGTYWLRTKFRLDLPKQHDIQLGLAFGDTSQPRSETKSRVLMFVNGWNMGNFISHVGPQRTFVLPPGVLNANGDNTIALAVTTDGKPENALEPVRLVTLRAVRGGVPVSPVAQPQQTLR
jgi:beta-galactosidase GanA